MLTVHHLGISQSDRVVWLCEELSMMLFPLTTMRVFVPRDLSPYPQIRANLQRIADRAAYQRASSKADPAFTAPLN